MNESFENFTITVTRAYKNIQQIKKHQSMTFGVKGIHVMCLFFLSRNPDGLTVTELASLCCEDKAAISRTMDSLVENEYAAYVYPAAARRRWRAKLILTDMGREAAAKMDKLINEVVDNAREGLTDEELRCFYKVFFSINDRLAKYCEYLETRER